MGARVLPIRRVEGSIDEMSDEALLAACASGDRAALGALFDRHYASVRMFLAHYVTCDDTDVDDLVQNTFVTVQRIAGTFQKRSEVKSWILGVARNVGRRYIRTRLRQRKIAVALVNEPTPTGELPDDRVLRLQRIARVRTAISSLSPKLREVFVLVYVQGLSGTEAAKALGIREGAVWKRLHTARKKVRATMGEDS